ncbi:MAG: CrcB family protein [Gammaproteobacteria bacterium]|nr:CrcB family protein [Gammaproteobacteria bacterium]
MSGWWLVGLGSLLGGALRVLVALAMDASLQSPLALDVAAASAHSLPWATVVANTTGSFAIGLYAVLYGPGGRWPAAPGQQQFVMAGLCGGYTTFSIFSLEAVAMLARGEAALAGVWTLGNIVLWLAAAAAGMSLGERLAGTGAD